MVVCHMCGNSTIESQELTLDVEVGEYTDEVIILDLCPECMDMFIDDVMATLAVDANIN